MNVIPIEPVPNQEVTINADGNRWTLRIKAARSTMVADVSLNDVLIVQGQRIVPGTPLLPYEYAGTAGNFLFLIDGEELPDYSQFGASQSLLYVGPGEVDLS